MAILKKRTRDNFTIISNDIFKDRELSMKGRGLLCTMLSLPDNWRFSEKGLGSLFPDGQCALRSAIKELTELGYLMRSRVRKDGCIAGWEWVISDHREFTSKTKTKNDESIHKRGADDFDSLNLGNHNLENLNSENLHLLNTKESITKESRTKEMEKLTNSETQKNFENQVSKARAYEMTTASEHDVDMILPLIEVELDTDGSTDRSVQEAFIREPLDWIMARTSASIFEVADAVKRLVAMQPRLRRKSASYLLRDCGQEICTAIEDARSGGVNWSKW